MFNVGYFTLPPGSGGGGSGTGLTPAQTELLDGFQEWVDSQLIAVGSKASLDRLQTIGEDTLVWRYTGIPGKFGVGNNTTVLAAWEKLLDKDNVPKWDKLLDKDAVPKWDKLIDTDQVQSSIMKPTGLPDSEEYLDKLLVDQATLILGLTATAGSLYAPLSLAGDVSDLTGQVNVLQTRAPNLVSLTHFPGDYLKTGTDHLLRPWSTYICYVNSSYVGMGSGLFQFAFPVTSMNDTWDFVVVNPGGSGYDLRLAYIDETVSFVRGVNRSVRFSTSYIKPKEALRLTVYPASLNIAGNGRVTVVEQVTADPNPELRVLTPVYDPA